MVILSVYLLSCRPLTWFDIATTLQGPSHDFNFFRVTPINFIRKFWLKFWQQLQKDIQTKFNVRYTKRKLRERTINGMSRYNFKQYLSNFIGILLRACFPGIAGTYNKGIFHLFTSHFKSFTHRIQILLTKYFFTN